ncbi:NAD(P)/FAD-dependent oxidoreductase [Herbiconiux sp. VKM Ac-2851]|uniref:NAD(P)/FAD-dependent oxidoreductase n=1 Tax=Herbiconiux sp. VKM Ac-2851 TaxID=2739025 RepID=UPI0015650D35|nr:NAD(P)/FAD-dependent oxidoreductase [Herbiconiux sp. VKM Ac-2851]NQX35918.1 NAD(P)/FAD-dependent oxidoreductase [Herbiconiux sp. VKM Ac-2851]
MNENEFDVIVVGGGAAGLNAALVLARSRRRVVVVDAGEPRNRFTAHMHGFLTRDGFDPAELLRIGRDEVRGYGATILEGRAITATGSAGAFEVMVETAASETREAETRTLKGRRIVIATGLRDELPPIDGLQEQWGRGAVACPYCDGWEARDSRVVVIAASARASHQAELMRQLSDDVTIVGRVTAELETETLRGFAARGIRVGENDVVRVERIDETRERPLRLTLDDGSTLEADAVFTGGALVPNDELLRQLGAETVAGPMGEWTASDPTGLTSVPGVWVAGNSANAGALVIVAAASGLTAATVINYDLVQDDIAQALEFQALRPPALRP